MRLKEILRMIETSNAAKEDNVLNERVATRSTYDMMLADTSIKMGFECEMVLRDGHQTVANRIRRLTGEPVEIVNKYHGTAKGLDTWYIEPDESIEDDFDDGEPGEIVSPVFDLTTGLDRMKAIFDLAQSNGDITNKSTGLHVSISIEGKDRNDYDWLKMMLFFDENYVGKLFGRENNGYAVQLRSRLAPVVSLGAEFPDDNMPGPYKALKSRNVSEIVGVLKAYGRNLSGIFGRKSSINNRRNGVFEFRIMGGEDYHKRYNEVRKQVLRMANVVRIGSDPDLYARDYITRIMLIINSDKYRNQNIGPKKATPKPKWVAPKELAALVRPLYGEPVSALGLLNGLAFMLETREITLTPSQRAQVKLMILRLKIEPEAIKRYFSRDILFNQIASIMGWSLMDIPEGDDQDQDMYDHALPNMRDMISIVESTND